MYIFVLCVLFSTPITSITHVTHVNPVSLLSDRRQRHSSDISPTTTRPRQALDSNTDTSTSEDTNTNTNTNTLNRVRASTPKGNIPRPIQTVSVSTSASACTLPLYSPSAQAASNGVNKYSPSRVSRHTVVDLSSLQTNISNHSIVTTKLVKSTQQLEHEAAINKIKSQVKYLIKDANIHFERENLLNYYVYKRANKVSLHDKNIKIRIKVTYEFFIFTEILEAQIKSYYKYYFGKKEKQLLSNHLEELDRLGAIHSKQIADATSDGMIENYI